MRDLEKLLEETTPGPWAVRNAKIGGDKGIASEIGGKSCILAEAWADIRYAGECSDDEAAANARLIAMAPDLARKVIAAEKLVEALSVYAAGIGFWEIEDGGQIARDAIEAWEAAQ